MMRKFLWIVLSAAAIFAAALFFVKNNLTQAGNETSRLAMIQSVVDNGTFDISGSIFHTSDKACYAGHVYCDKPPLLLWFSAGEYFLLAKVFGFTFQNNRSVVIFLLYLPYFLMGIGTGFLFYFCLKEYLEKTKSSRYCAYAAFLSVCSTLVFSYSVTMGNHVPCAFFLMLLMFLMIRIVKLGPSESLAFFLGVAAGLVFNCEFVLGGVCGLGAAFFVVSLPDISWGKRFRLVLSYAAGGLLLIALEGLMNFITYGSPLPLYLLSHKPALTDRNGWYYAWNCLFGFEGFFLYMPSCLFVFPVLFRPFRGKDRVCVTMLLTAFVSTVIFLCSTSDYGGFCYGFRFLVPLAPVLLFYVFLSFYGKRRKGFCGFLLTLALLWGIITAVAGTFNPWNSGYEGSNTPHGNMNEKIRNGFSVNAFVFLFETYPDSQPVRFFIEHIYGPKTAFFCLAEEFINRNQREKIPAAALWFHKHYPEKQ